MNFNSVINFFLPKDKVFYILFEKVADTLEEMASLLEKGVNLSDKEKRKELFQQIAQMEHQNDDTTHKIFVELGQNFITPFDREDIHTLASTLDDIADYIHEASKKMVLYNFYEINDSISGICEVIHKSTIEVKTAIFELRSMRDVRKIKEACVKINSYENRGDDIYDGSVARLFESEEDTRRIIIMKEIFLSLETATDKCEDVANVLESIIIKYA